MNHISFGSVLKEARISKGYELNAVSRRLRIRPDILEAIENSDFDRMPPRGYSRNMINAYARFLGLNANDVTRMYLDESYANQIGRAHQNAIENRYMHQNTSRATSRPESASQPTNSKRSLRIASASTMATPRAVEGASIPICPMTTIIWQKYALVLKRVKAVAMIRSCILHDVKRSLMENT